MSSSQHTMAVYDQELMKLEFEITRRKDCMLKLQVRHGLKGGGGVCDLKSQLLSRFSLVG